MQILWIVNYVCFGIQDGLLVSTINPHQRDCQMPRLNSSRWLCWTLFRRSLFTFTDFTISIFSNKGRYPHLKSIQFNQFQFQFHFLIMILSWAFSRWYQIKITMRWEHTEYTSVGTPARVVQYEGAFFHFHFHLWSKVVKYPSCFLVAISVINGIIKYPSCF